MHRSWATYPNSTERQACVKDLEHNIGLAFKISTWQKIESGSWRMSYSLRQLFGHIILIPISSHKFLNFLKYFYLLDE